MSHNDKLWFSFCEIKPVLNSHTEPDQQLETSPTLYLSLYPIQDLVSLLFVLLLSASSPAHNYDVLTALQGL